LAQVNEGVSRKLTLISAPAGFGKTTLLSEWHASAAGQHWPLTWLSLDESDSDPARFLTYLIAALQQIDPAVGHAAQAMLQSLPPPPEALLTALINDVANVAAPFVLVLDDYHVIDSPPIHQHLAFLLEHQPPQMHVVILTREDGYSRASEQAGK
jgi:LuxR family maltose regulon positive regulatory protein